MRSESPEKHKMDLDLNQKQLTEAVLQPPLPITLLKTQTDPDIHPKSQRFNWKSLHAPLWESLSELLPSGHSTTQPTDSIVYKWGIHMTLRKEGKYMHSCAFLLLHHKTGKTVSAFHHSELKYEYGNQEKKKVRSPQLSPCQSKKQLLLSQGGMSPKLGFPMLFRGTGFYCS